MSDGRDVTLSVPEINCEHCVKTIDSSLRALPGVDDIHIDLQAKKVHLHYNPDKVTVRQLESTLDEIGYTVAK